MHYGAQWNDDAVGSQLTDPPNLDYVNAYWKSPTDDFVSFLTEVKNNLRS